MTLHDLNTLPAPALHEALRACCGSPHWVATLAATRPWDSHSDVLRAAEAGWQGLSPAELARAVAHHPRLGESRAAAAVTARARAWSADEQAGTPLADEATRAALAQGNLDYEARFGHTFILCASGRSAADMLVALRARMTNDADTELTVTAHELWLITRLRLQKLLGGA